MRAATIKLLNRRIAGMSKFSGYPGNYFRMFFRALFMMFFLLYAPTLTAQEKINLMFRYQPGEIYTYRYSDTFECRQEVREAEMNLGGGNNSMFKMEVASVSPDTSITFIVTCEEMKSFVNNPDTVTEYIELVGKRAKVVLDRLGRETEKEWMDSVNISGSTVSLMMGSYRSVNFFQLPGHPLAAGEHWSARINDSAEIVGGYVKQTESIEYSLNGFSQKNGHDCLKIGYVSRSENLGKASMEGMEIYIEGTGDTTGTIWFDPDAGILVYRESSIMQEMTYTITGSMSMSVPLIQTIKSTCSLVED